MANLSNLRLNWFPRNLVEMGSKSAATFFAQLTIQISLFLRKANRETAPVGHNREDPGIETLYEEEQLMIPKICNHQILISQNISMNHHRILDNTYLQRGCS